MFYCFSGGLLTIVSANVGSYEWSPWLRFSMTEDLDERTYDLLRLIRRYEPIGSIRLVTLMERHGYSIQGRTIRLTLSDLDERGMTEKVPGKGRRLTTSGQEALETGNVGSRLEQIRSRIATLTSQVTYDPVEDTGDLISAAAYLDAESVEPVLKTLAALDDLPLAPCLVAVDEASVTEPGDYRLTLPSSLTLDGVLLSGGISTRLVTGGIAEYNSTADAERVFTDDPSEVGGEIRRYIDVISGRKLLGRHRHAPARSQSDRCLGNSRRRAGASHYRQPRVPAGPLRGGQRSRAGDSERAGWRRRPASTS